MPSVDRIRTKIVTTIGPACESPAMLEKFIRAGVDVVRLNFSHGSHEEHGRRIAAVQKIRQRLDRPVAIMADMAGPKMRIGYLGGGSIELRRGAEVFLIDAEHNSQPNEIPFPGTSILQRVETGHSILLQDGNIQLNAEGALYNGRVKCRVKSGGLLFSEQGIYFPVSAGSVPAVTDKDREDIEFCVSKGVDIIAVSFVKNASDVKLAREAVHEAGGKQFIIAKIEKPEALRELKKIVDAADGIMVARGDLGVEIPIERVPLEQKRIITLCNKRGKPVITATQMLESMTERPRPTRAEVTDVANSILDGTDAVMLSGETAVGKNPLKVVRTMSRIIRATEKEFPFGRRLFDELRGKKISTDSAIARGACGLARDLRLDAIVCCTQSGSTARLVSSWRPETPIFALTLTPESYQSLALSWGVVPIMLPEAPAPAPEVGEIDWMIEQAIQAVSRAHIHPRCRDIVITAGVPLLTPGTTNFIRVVKIVS